MLLTILLFISVTTCGASRNLEVSLSDGSRLMGSILKTLEGKKIASFMGIPYAEPPLGELRFKPPVAKKSWTGTLDATKYGSVCPHNDLLSGDYIGDENCLFVNVFTQEETDKNDDLLPVMFWIHGGSFNFGAGNFYGPEVIMDSPIVFVNVNYRLGALGFLSTGSKESPGNYGLLDQNLALKWVQSNIRAFGGDPDKVTLMGESAGSTSVGYQILSPLSKGLFQQAIMMSSTPLCLGTVQTKPLDRAIKMAKDVGCPSWENPEEIMACLKKTPAEVLVKNYVWEAFVYPLGFTPVVDGHFVPKLPRDMIMSGELNKVPLVIGVTEDEGALVYGSVLSKHKNNATSEKFIRSTLHLMLDNNLVKNEQEYKEMDKIVDVVMEKYFDEVDWNDRKQIQVTSVNLYGDIMFDSCHYETVHHLFKSGFKMYSYSFDYKGSNNFPSLMLGGNQRFGVGHGDELFSLFHFPSFQGYNPLSEKDLKSMKVFRTLFTNFAKYGDPTPETTKLLPVKWEPVTSSIEFDIFHINLHVGRSKYKIKRDAVVEFWTQDIRKLLDGRGKKSAESTKEELGCIGSTSGAQPLIYHVPIFFSVFCFLWLVGSFKTLN